MVSHYTEGNRYLKTHNIVTFATGLSLEKENLHSLFVTHLLSLGDAQEELRQRKKKSMTQQRLLVNMPIRPPSGIFLAK